MDTLPIIDIAIIVIFAAFVIVNLVRGFFKRVFKIAVTIGALLIAYFFCDNLVTLLEDKFELLTKLTNKITELDLFKVSADVIKGSLSESIASAIAEMKLPDFIADAAQKALLDAEMGISNSVEGITVHIATILSRYIMIGASFVALHIVSKLILSIAAAILTKIIELPVLNSIDKLLGAIMGMIKGFLVITVLIYLVSIVPQLDNIRDMLMNESTLGKFLLDNNLFETIISAVVSKLPK